MPDNSTLQDHVNDLLEERAQLYEQIQALQTSVQMWIAANQRLTRQLNAAEEHAEALAEHSKMLLGRIEELCGEVDHLIAIVPNL
jgi:serine phosphatase RsbU (regulator of sigma subunit)